MKKTIIHPLLSLLIAITLFISGCDNLTGSDDNGLDTAPPVYDFSATSSAIDAFIQEVEAVKGSSIIIVTKASGVIYKAAFGNHTVNTIVLLASTSKVPSAGIVMSLVDEGLIELGTPVSEYLDWDNANPDITAGQLVSNTSGLPGLTFDDDLYMPHICQYLPILTLSECAEAIYETDHGDDFATPGTEFRYGGGQWHVAGGLAEAVSEKSWAELVDEKLADPCDLEVFEYGNQLSTPETWTGSPEDLVGRSNPNLEGGAISNLDDYAKILMMHLNNGVCGEERVLSESSIMEMRVNRGTAAGGPAYGMGWWITLPGDGSDPTLFSDAGAYGTMAWIDTAREYGAYFALQTNSVDGGELYSRIRPLIEAAIDNPN